MMPMPIQRRFGLVDRERPRGSMTEQPAHTSPSLPRTAGNKALERRVELGPQQPQRAKRNVEPD